jgi:MFS transporter, FSR family, fosmidomycin resistance protein
VTTFEPDCVIDEAMSGGISRAPGRLAATVGVHFTVDAFAFVIVALLPLLTTRLDLSNGQKAMVLALGSVSSGMIQPIVAMLSDRYNTRLLGTIGFLVAVVSVGMIGFVNSFVMLLVVQGVSAAGIGAFHPPAAAAAGHLSGKKRTLGVSFFFLAGMLGGVCGNTLSPLLVDLFSPIVNDQPMVERGLKSLAFLMIPGFAAVVLLGWAIHKAPHSHANAHKVHAELSDEQRRLRWFAVSLLYVSNVLRFTVNMILLYLYISWAKRYVLTGSGATALTDALGLEASTLFGVLAGSMQVGMGSIGLAAGFLLRKHHEKAAMVLLPVIGAVAIAGSPYVDGLPMGVAAAAVVLAILAGVGFGSMIPVSISLAQRLLPHRTGLASSLMLGGAWMFAATGPFVAMWAEGRLGLEGAFMFTAGLLLVAGLVVMGLPGRLVREA